MVKEAPAAMDYRWRGGGGESFGGENRGGEKIGISWLCYHVNNDGKPYHA
jgi:hypothetical protein